MGLDDHISAFSNTSGLLHRESTDTSHFVDIGLIVIHTQNSSFNLL